MGLSGFSGNLVLFLGILVVYAKVERELAFDDTYCRFCGVIFPLSQVATCMVVIAGFTVM